MDLDRIAVIKQRFLTLASCMPMDDFLSGWFLGAPSDQVLRENVEDFIAYGFYCRKLEELSPEVSRIFSRLYSRLIASSLLACYRCMQDIDGH